MENLENLEIEKEKVILVEEYKESLIKKIKDKQEKRLKVKVLIVVFFTVCGSLLYVFLYKWPLQEVQIGEIIFVLLALYFSSIFILYFIDYLYLSAKKRKINKKTFFSKELSSFLEEKKEELREEIETDDEDIKSELIFLENSKKDAEENIEKITKRKEEQSSYLQKLEKITF